MESMSQPPTKKTRYLRNIEFPVTECRREFNLPQQFPSMAPMKKSISVANEESVTSATNPPSTPATVKDRISNQTLVMNTAKKLRIRSQDGKDLGEIKVRFLSHDDVLNSKTRTFAKSSMSSQINKPIKFSVVPSERTNTLSTLWKDTKGSLPTEKLISKKLRGDGSIEKLRQRPIPSCKSLNKPDENDNARNRKFVKETVPCTNSNVLKHLKAPNSFIQIGTIKNRNLLVRKTDDLNNLEKLNLKDNIPEIVNKTNTLNIEMSSNLNGHWQLANSIFPVVKCEKLIISQNKININELHKLSENPTNQQNSASTIDAQNNKIEETIVKSSKTPCNARLDESTEYNLNIQAGLINPVIPKTPYAIAQDNHRNRVKPQNCVTTMHSDKNTTVTIDSNNARTREYILIPATNKCVHNETQNILNNVNGPVSFSNEKTCNSGNVQKKDSSFQNTISSTNNIQDTVTNLSDKEKQSQHWNIIKEALISVKDEDLRSKALQALADCGIGIAKQVPIIPPEQQRTVHDSQIQTDVFGLLDLESFVLVKKDTPTLGRINQTERSISNTPINTDRSVQLSTKSNNYIDNIDLSSMLNPMTCIDNNDDIDNYFNKVFSGNKDANRVNRILSTPYSLYKKVATQLQKDVEAMQQWDENGMLNIHRAVVRNNLHEVQRLLLVLNASKISIDVLTEDGMTCLELAVKSNSSREIAHVLLDAGAKPVSTELLHESAVLLGSKLSSPLLSDLLRYVVDCKLVNQVDSEGFAPLHYCVLNGNIEGVNALIEAGAEVNLRDNRSGRSPFFHALEHSRISIAQKLLEYGAIANLPNFSGQSVLSLVDDVKSLSLKAALKNILL